MPIRVWNSQVSPARDPRDGTQGRRVNDAQRTERRAIRRPSGRRACRVLAKASGGVRVEPCPPRRGAWRSVCRSVFGESILFDVPHPLMRGRRERVGSRTRPVGCSSYVCLEAGDVCLDTLPSPVQARIRDPVAMPARASRPPPSLRTAGERTKIMAYSRSCILFLSSLAEVGPRHNPGGSHTLWEKTAGTEARRRAPGPRGELGANQRLLVCARGTTLRFRELGSSTRAQ